MAQILYKKNIAICITQFRGVTRGAEGGRSPCPFSKIGKKCPDFGHLRVEFLIQNTIFKSFQEKTPEILSCGAFLSPFFHHCLSKCANSKKTLCPKKFLVARLQFTVFCFVSCISTYSFLYNFAFKHYSRLNIGRTTHYMFFTCRKRNDL